MRVFLRVLVGATIVADTIGLVLYGAVVRLPGDTILQDALVFAGAIAFAVMLILALAAVESRGRSRRKRTTARTAAPAPTPQRIAAPPLRPIRPTVIGASEAPTVAQPIAKAPVQAPAVTAPAPSPRVTPTNVSPAPALATRLATRLAPAPALASRIAPAAAAPSQVVQESPRATEAISAPAFAPEPIAVPALAPELEWVMPTELEWVMPAELEWVMPAELGGPEEPQPFFELPAIGPEVLASSVTPTPEPARIGSPAEAPIVEASVAEAMTQPAPETADLARWREQALSLVIPQAPEPPTTEPETRIPELDAIVRALDVLRAAETQEQPRLVVIPGGKTWRSAS